MAGHQRHRIVRADGKQIYLVPKKGHLTVCARGCCCGRTDRGNPAVPIDYYKAEYARRKLRKHIQLTMSGCIGPCPMMNAVQLVFDGRPVWLQSVNATGQIDEIYNYLEAMVAADGFLPPPVALQPFVFDYYRWNHNNVVSGMPAAFADQTSGSSGNGILFLTHADTDLDSIHRACGELPTDFVSVRAASLLRGAGDESMDSLLAAQGHDASIIVARLFGHLDAIPGIERLTSFAQQGRRLILLSGVDGLDPDFVARSTVSPHVMQDVAAYFEAGGPANMANGLRYLADHLLMTGFGYDPPQQLPEHGIYSPETGGCITQQAWLAQHDPLRPVISVLFYRSHWTSGNLDFVDALIDEIENRGAQALPIFTSSLKHGTQRTEAGQTEWTPAAFELLMHPETGEPLPEVLISTLSFAAGDGTGADEHDTLSRLGVPVLQAITSGSPRWQWEVSSRGLNPLDTAMNVALPELDGRIITTPISFKEAVPRQAGEETTVYRYQPDLERIERVVGLAMGLIRLRGLPNQEKRIAVVLTNLAGKAHRIGNAVGLDAPASLIRLLHALQAAGYDVPDVPRDGDALIHELIDRGCYDESILTEQQLSHAAGRVPSVEYERWFRELPETLQRRMEQQWGAPPGAAYVHDGAISLAGLELGNVFIAIQPPRGYGLDANAIYHQPDLPPTHHFYAMYRWLRDTWQADAIVHLGKHGTLEWLPGKSLGLSADCFPDAILGDLPLIYPFIINDPGEGSQAKRRSHAVIIDHLTPALTTADAYGPLAELSLLVDEYYQVEQLDPSKLPLLQQQIWDLIKQSHLDEDLKRVMTQDHGHTHEWDEGTTDEGTPLTLASMQGTEVAHVLEELDAYLCELGGAQIRDGLHILGVAPEDEQRIDTLQAMTRIPNLACPSLRESLVKMFGLEPDELLDGPGAKFAVEPPELAALAGRPLITHSDALEAIDEVGKRILRGLWEADYDLTMLDQTIEQSLATNIELSLDRSGARNDLRTALEYICRSLCPALDKTTDEIDHLLEALDGRHVPPGPSGAPSRGMVHILPTGRNFYSVDPRALPSTTAWRVGQSLANQVLQQHRGDTGAYPETVGISIWGTSSMRTHGDDVAQVFALWGVRPVWRKESRRVTGIEVIPLNELGRPRIDVVVRISGFFRDAFPHLIRLLDEAVEAVAQLDEPLDQNFVRKHYLEELEPAIAAGECEFDADRKARYRIFSSKPGGYGAGVWQLIDSQNWQTMDDFAQSFVDWGGYAYTAEEQGVDARDIFRRRLSGVQAALHNQDNREHDIFDSDDYLQFHGGMIATIRALTGRKPQHYFGDSQDPSRPKVRDLKSEVARVIWTRVVNPKWLESIRRHGYKGGLELAATVDFLFGYDATADVVEDWMYQQVAEAYSLDPEMQQFLEQSNPWALRAMTQRLLEAQQRGLWSDVSPETLAALRQVLRNSESLLEGRGESVASSGQNHHTCGKTAANGSGSG